MLIQVSVQHSNSKVIVVKVRSFKDKCLFVCSFTETVWDGRTVFPTFCSHANVGVDNLEFLHD